MKFLVEERQLKVIDDAGVVLWRKAIEGHDVEWAQQIEGTRDAVVLLSYNQPPHRELFHNLLRLTADGVIRWRAETPSRDDRYVAVLLSAAELKAYTLNGFTVWIDPVSGKIENQVFTK